MNVSKLSRISFCNYLGKFRLAHSAVSKADSEIGLLPKQDAKITKNVTGVTVASVENYSPVSRVSILVKAGSRYEPSDQLGISHSLRNCTVLSTNNKSAFLITRDLELHGAKLKVTSTREYLIYTLQCPRDYVDTGLEHLADITTNHLFNSWEVDDASSRLHFDLALMEKSPEAALMEALHEASFRGGLSHSLFCRPFNIGRYGPDMLQDYVSKTFTAPRVIIAGLGIEHENLENSVTQHFNIDRVFAGSVGESKFAAGEKRIEANLPYTQAAIVAEGAGISNTKDMLSLGVFQNILGVGVNHKHGTPQFTKLGEAANDCTSHPYSVSSLNINYSDTGLFGVHIAGHPNDMAQLAKSIISYMKGASKNLTEENLKIGKHKLKAKLAFERETSTDLLHDMAIKTASVGKIQDFKEIEKAIDALTLSDVSAVACKVMKAKPAMAAIGPLHSTPHVDELI